MHHREAGAIMGVGMTDTGGFDLYEYVAIANFRDRNILHFQRAINADESNGFHWILVIKERAVCFQR